MKRNRRRLPVPQHEFGFTPAAFNLMVETALDGDRITRERAEADEARRMPRRRRPRFSPSPHTMTMNNQNPFGAIVYAYSRAQAIADGFQVEVTKSAQEAGIKFPVFLTRSVFDAYVTVPPGVTGQDEAGRLWDVVWMLRFAILRSAAGCERLPFALYVRNDNRKPKLVKLIASCGPLDLDDPQPAITVMLPNED